MAEFKEKNGFQVRTVDEKEKEVALNDPNVKVAVIVENIKTGHEWLLTAKEVPKKEFDITTGRDKATIELKGLSQIVHKLEEPDMYVIQTKNGGIKKKSRNAYQLLETLKGEEILEEEHIEQNTVSERLLKEKIRAEVLAELEGEAEPKGEDNKAELVAKAKELGVKSAHMFGIDKLKEKIEEATK